MTNVKKEIKKINDEIDFEKARLERIREKYKRECGNFLKRLFVTDENYVLKKQAIENKMSNQKDLVTFLETKLSTCTTLSFNFGMHFIAEVISLIENEKYSFIKISFPENNIIIPFVGCTNECFYQTIDTEIGLIARDKIIEKEAEKCHHSPKYLVANLIEKGEKNIIIQSFYDLEIYNSNGVPKELITDFPYLEQVCAEIVSLKLKNSDLSEEDICQEYLRNLKMKLTIRRGTYHK